MNPSCGPLPEICMMFEAPKNFFCSCKKPDLNASFIIYTYIHTIYIFTCINTLNFLNIKLMRSLSDKCTFTFFTLRYQLIFKDLGTVLNVSRLPLLCLTLLKYIWEKKKRFILKYYSSENLKSESTKIQKRCFCEIFLMYLFIFGAFFAFSVELHMFEDALKHDWDLYYLWFKCVDKCICVHA